MVPVSTDWTNPCNWTPNGVPTATNPVSIINDVTNSPVINTSVMVSSLMIRRNLTINASGSLTTAGEYRQRFIYNAKWDTH